MASNSINNPWKGLNFYTEGEVLYGRNSEIQSLSQYIFNNTQTVLYGRSGIGKSSILNAGIFPKARVAGMIPVSIRLKHDEENNYLEQIRLSIETAGLIINEILPPINGIENETLWEFMHRHTFNNGDGDRRIPLLVFDQFEEIFTLQKKENLKREFFRQLGNLFNDVKPAYIVEHENQARQQQTSQQETKVVSSGAFKGLNLKLNIRRNDREQEKVARYIEHPDYHIVFAMREDFLSSLELYAASIPVMKDNRFGLLPINEEQAADIIRLPREGLVDNQVTKLIIQQVTGREDFELDGKPEIEVDAAVLSLFLSRLYIKKPELENRITSELVNTYSGHIIHDFYVDSVTSNEDENEILSKDTVLLLENLLLTREGRRNNVSRSDLIAQGVTEEELTILIEKRKLLRQFHHGNDIRIEYIHDILCPVVKERIEQRELLLKQEQERQRQEEEKRQLIENQKKQRRFFMVGTSLVLSVLGIILVIIGVDYYLHTLEYEVYYSNYTKKNGWPVGVGNPLSKHERESMDVYYKLSKKGHSDNSNFTEVEVMSSTSLKKSRIATPLVYYTEVDSLQDSHASKFALLLNKTERIVFEGKDKDINSYCSKETYFDVDNHPLFVLNNFKTFNQLEETQILWGAFTNPSGSALQVRDNGADRMKIFTDKDGYETKYLFYDPSGAPKENFNGSYGFQVEYDSLMRITNLYHLNAFSQIKLTENRQYKDSLLIQEFFEGKGSKIPTEHDIHGYHKRISTIDNHGNVVRNEYYASNGKPIINRPCTELFFYDKSGRCDSVIYSYDPKTTDVLTQCTKKEFSYYNNSLDLKSKKYYKMGNGADRILYYSYSVTKENNTTNIIENDSESDFYRHERIVLDENNGYEEHSFYDKNGRPVFDIENQFFKQTISTKKIKAKSKNGTIKVTKYYDENNDLYSDKDNAKSYPAIDSCYFDNNGLLITQISYDKDYNIVLSMKYEYIDNVEVGRYALSVDGINPIRCPQWEADGLCYYKLNTVRNFNESGFNLSYIEVQSEYPQCDSYVYFDTSSPLLLFEPDSVSIGEGWNFITYKAIAIKTVPRDAHKVPYVHINSLGGAAYAVGIKDGDILIRSNEWTFVPNSVLQNLPLLDNAYKKKGLHIEVMRFQNGKWTRKIFNVASHDKPLGMEVYPVAYTDKEYELIKRYY